VVYSRLGSWMQYIVRSRNEMKRSSSSSLRSFSTFRLFSGYYARQENPKKDYNRSRNVHRQGGRKQ
jgi:hypothetical protein